uniref:RFX-type winged-helix domain-containing protein n=1 Tax=Graphocephala atropunctata TaxID=36148 RepID=A0A1B6M4T6_9HEMI
MEVARSNLVSDLDSYHNAINSIRIKVEESIWNESEAASNGISPPCGMQEKLIGFDTSENDFMDLPNRREGLPDQLLDQLRPLNPLGNRTEVSQALAYIKSRFIQNPDVSLPKKEIYTEYTNYCQRRLTKPLSTADFGKVMKQVYPGMRPRRLGERGNSRYCYSGLSYKDNLHNPNNLLFSSQEQDEVSKKICTWASHILKTRVNSLAHLNSIISSSPVDTKSETVQDSHNCVLQERFPIGLPDKKRKSKVDSVEASQSKSVKKKKTSTPMTFKSEKTFDRKDLNSLGNSSSAQSPQNSTVATGSYRKNICDISNQNQNVVDILEIKKCRTNCFDLIPVSSTNVKKRRKATASQSSLVTITQTSKENGDTYRLMRRERGSSAAVLEPVLAEDNFGIVSIEEDPLEEVKCRDNEIKIDNSLNFSGKPPPPNDIRQLNSNLIRNINMNMDINESQDCDQSEMCNADLGYLTTESLHDYLQDEGNSQEPEEELLKYFKYPVKSKQKEYSSDKNMSQLRLLLEQNISEDAVGKFPCEPSKGSFGEECSKSKQVYLNKYLTPTLQKNLLQPAQKSVFTGALTNSTGKRRVSFENNIPDLYPQSPNIHGKNFSFTPISPRPPTVSKSILNSSPFVFPRDTIFRGKLSATNNSNHQLKPSPSPVLHAVLVPVSPFKSSSRSTSLSSIPSPITNNCSSSSNTVFKSRSTPQDANQEQLEYLKYSPLISPSSSSVVFLSPASPMSSCNSPVFSFKKSMSPVKLPDDSKSSVKPNSSLLQSLLLTGKRSETNIPIGNKSKYNTINESYQKQTQPLVVDVSQFQSERPASFRSHSLPTLTTNEAISPKSNTLPFTFSISKNPNMSSPNLQPIESYMWDSVLNGYKKVHDTLMTEDTVENETLNEDSEIVGNDESMETVISNICEFLNDNDIARTSATDNTHVSRSQPNTPLSYNECSNSSRDPIVSALPLMSASTPIACKPQAVDSSIWSAKRNITALLDNLPIPAPLFSDDIDLHLNNLAELSGCDDTFNELAQEVASTEFKEL